MARRKFVLPDGKGIYVHREKASTTWKRLEHRRDDGLVEVTVAPGRVMSAPREVWENAIYRVSVSRFSAHNFIDGGAFARIGIERHDQSAEHDFRDYQHIKNDVCGEDWEAMELYPAEARLVDPSNFFILWAFPPGVLNIGMAARQVLDLGEAQAPQRPFPDGQPRRPRRA